MIIEKIIIEYLMDALSTDNIYVQVPEKPEEEYFIIEKTGGSESNHIRSSTIAIQSYGKSTLRAMELNEEVKAAMKGLPVLPEIGSCRLNSDYNFNNIEKKQYRYQAVFDITHY